MYFLWQQKLQFSLLKLKLELFSLWKLQIIFPIQSQLQFFENFNSWLDLQNWNRLKYKSIASHPWWRPFFVWLKLLIFTQLWHSLLYITAYLTLIKFSTLKAYHTINLCCLWFSVCSCYFWTSKLRTLQDATM